MFGNLVDAWSTYESRRAAQDAHSFARGIDALQIVHVRGRTWSASIMWDEERPGLALPGNYLKQY